VNSQQYYLFNLLRRALKSAAALTALAVSSLVASAFAQNPVPQIVGPVHPDAVAPGGGDFTLSVYGANFVPGAVVNWNYQLRATTYISGHELQAQILSTDIAKNTAGYITVTNPAPGGGSSSASWAQVEVHAPIAAVAIGQPLHYAIAYPLATDFNGDGILDLLGEYVYDLVLDEGNGKGAFPSGTLAGKYYLPGTEFSYGDFNGDGNVDVVLIEGSPSKIAPTQMQVMLGDGKGNFSAGPITRYPIGLGLLLVGDFNQDGKLDLITKAGAVDVFLGNGDGTFQHLLNYPYSNLTQQMVAGDFNNDGKLDLILLQGLNRGGSKGLTLWLLQGNGDGTFQSPKKIAYDPGVSTCNGGDGFQGAVQLSDFNGDGNLDIAYCNSKGNIHVLLGNGDGTFQTPIVTFTWANAQFGFAIGDFNSDGKPDFVVSNFLNEFTSSMVFFLGNGDGTFQQSQSISSDGGNDDITVGDFNNDGLVDAIFMSGLGAEVYLQQ
jgi:hypothetical protein